MNEEQIREIAKETFAENIMNNLDSSIVFKYIQELEQENKKYKEVIDELRNYLKTRVEVCDNRLSTPFCNFEKTTKGNNGSAQHYVQVTNNAHGVPQYIGFKRIVVQTSRRATKSHGPADNGENGEFSDHASRLNSSHSSQHGRG